MTSCTPLPCRFKSSWGHNNQVMCKCLAVASQLQEFHRGYFPVPMQVETTEAFSTINLSSEVIVRCECLGIYGRENKYSPYFFTKNTLWKLIIGIH